MINLIYASDINGVIGKGNGLPWHFKEDLSYFKELTKGSSVLVGRKTYESLPFFPKGLPSRKNIVLSRTLESNEFITVISDLPEYLKSFPKAETLWVIGGAEVYKQALQYANMVYRTNVRKAYDGDVVYTPDLSGFRQAHLVTIRPEVDPSVELEFEVLTRKR